MSIVLSREDFMFQVLYMGMAMLAPSIAFQAVSGLPVVASIFLMAAVCVTYTSLVNKHLPFLNTKITFTYILFKCNSRVWKNYSVL